jgi:hypothetical protein
MYCKNCKVKLKDYLDKCPLCHTKVTTINEESNPYNKYVEDFSTRVNIKYFSNLIVKIIILLSIITMLINLIVNKKISWSLYVVASSVYVCSYYLYIILENKKLAFIWNMASLEFLLFIISYLTHSTQWFSLLVGPIILMVCLFIMINVSLSRFNNILRNSSILLMYIACCLFTLDCLINIYKTGIFKIHWSIYSNIPIFIISILLFILSFNKTITNEIEKRFFI